MLSTGLPVISRWDVGSIVGATARTRWCRRWALAVVCALAAGGALPTRPAVAQDSDAQQRQAAGEAFDRGTAAYLARNYPQAAEWFETAHRLAPAAPALVQAIRAHQRAGNVMRAGTLALRLATQYPDDRASARSARDALATATSRYVRVDVVCTGCNVDLDGTLQDSPSFFVEGGGSHRVVAHFSTGDREETVRGVPGEQREVRLEAPPPTETTPVDNRVDGNGDGTTTTTTTTPTRAPTPTPTPRARSGLSPAVAIVGLALTVAAGGVLAWSGVDTLAGVDAYELSPTQAALDDGQAKELRTNVLIGVTAGLGVATAAIMIFFTDWGGDDSHERAPEGQAVHAAATFVPGGAMGVLGGTF